MRAWWPHACSQRLKACRRRRPTSTATGAGPQNRGCQDGTAAGGAAASGHGRRRGWRRRPPELRD
eukprot:1003876-Prymnesium_polylepis.1